MKQRRPTASKNTKGGSSKRPSRVISGIIGGLLIAIAGIWFIWLLLHQAGALVTAPPNIPISGLMPASNTPVAQITPLAEEGITLGYTSQAPKLNKQEALLIAGQLEPEAATKAQHVIAEYVLLTYPNTSTPATHANLRNVPAWLIEYQKVPVATGNSSSSSQSQSSYDLYVFLDANSGKELLVVQV